MNLVKTLRKSWVYSFSSQLAHSRIRIGIGNDCYIQEQIPNLFYPNMLLPSSVFALLILPVYYCSKSLTPFGDISGLWPNHHLMPCFKADFGKFFAFQRTAWHYSKHRCQSCRRRWEWRLVSRWERASPATAATWSWRLYGSKLGSGAYRCWTR